MTVGRPAPNLPLFQKNRHFANMVQTVSFLTTHGHFLVQQKFLVTRFVAPGQFTTKKCMPKRPKSAIFGQKFDRGHFNRPTSPWKLPRKQKSHCENSIAPGLYFSPGFKALFSRNKYHLQKRPNKNKTRQKEV